MSGEDKFDRGSQNDWYREARPSMRKSLPLSAPLVRLARRLGRRPTDMALSIPQDTIRRTMYPVIEEHDEQGRVSYRDAPQVIESPRSLVKR